MRVRAPLRWRLYRPFWLEASQARRLTEQALVVVALLLTGGCDAPKPALPAPATSVPPQPSTFNAATARSLSGRVIWSGSVPQIPVFKVMPNPLGGAILRQRQTRPNPNRPIIHPTSHGLAGAVVFLRGVDPQRAKPWDRAAVAVEQRDCQLQVLQGKTVASVGFVRQGDEIEMVSRDSWLHALHAGGASFFTLMFPDPNQPRRRKLLNPGIVELSSNSGYFWMRGYLFVDQHPYYCRTDDAGRFSLTGIPSGTYQLVAWHPNWQVARQERDPESGLVNRISFAPPLTIETEIALKNTDISDLVISMSAAVPTSSGKSEPLK
ncbi:hypothetical protein BH10PLA2_BH10PLA2_32890 [soil metagenome]